MQLITYNYCIVQPKNQKKKKQNKKTTLSIEELQKSRTKKKVTGVAFAKRRKISLQFSAVKDDASEFDLVKSWLQPILAANGSGGRCRVSDPKFPSIISISECGLYWSNRKNLEKIEQYREKNRTLGRKFSSEKRRQRREGRWMRKWREGSTWKRFYTCQ